jgi:IS605 OrfB family transposase
MQQTVTAKIKVITSESDRNSLHDTMKAYTDACRFVSGYVYDTHVLVQTVLNKNLYHVLRDRFGLRSQMAQSVIKTVIARYKSVLESRSEWIKPVFSKLQYDLVWNRDYSLNDGKFSVNTLTGRIKLSYKPDGMEKYFDDGIYKFGTAKLVCRDGRYYLHIPVTYGIPDCSLSDICNVVGIDRGVNFITATYDSRHKSGFVSGRAVKQKRAHYKELRRQLQRIGTPSSRRRLKRIGQRENRWMQDVNHQVSKALAGSNPSHTLFVLEDLTGIRHATEKVNRRHRYEMVSWSFHDLEQKLIYKAERNGSMVIKVSPKYTSQCCPVCGHTEKANRNKRMHLFYCRNCGYRSNDDRIGAMNLYRKGIEYLSDTVV